MTGFGYNINGFGVLGGAPGGTISAMTWGKNTHGQLGLGTSNGASSSPTLVGEKDTWLNVATGYVHTTAVKADGTLWAWGYNTRGELGQGNTTNRSSPIQIGTLTDWLKPSIGPGHAKGSNLCTKTDGTLWSWGYNVYGALGLGDQDHRSSPVQIGSLTDWAACTMGNLHAIAVKTDGTLWAWGLNEDGALGTGNETHRSSPVQIGSLTTWLTPSAGYAITACVKTDGTLWAWGVNDYGQIGQGTTGYNIKSPVQVGALTTWSKIACGVDTMMAIKTDGTLWGWGRNRDGELGLGNTTTYSSPVQVGSLTNWSQIDGGPAGNLGRQTHFVAIKTDGTLWAWGDNSNGQLGDGSTNDRSSPVQIGSLTTWLEANAGTMTTIALEGTA